MKKGEGVTRSHKKQSRKAAKRGLAPAAFQRNLVNTEEESKDDEGLVGPLQGTADHMDSMMAIILELFQRVHGQDKAVAEKLGYV